MNYYNQNFNKYANLLGAGWSVLRPYISRLTSLFARSAPKVRIAVKSSPEASKVSQNAFKVRTKVKSAPKSGKVSQDAKKIEDIDPKLSKIPTKKDIAKNAVYTTLLTAPFVNEAAGYIDAGIKDFANTYEGAKAIAEFNNEFEKATGRKPTTPETATYIHQLQQRNQELEAAAAGNKEQTSETVTPSQAKEDKFEIGKLFDISSPYAQYYTLPTAAGATLGGLLYGGKGSVIGGVGGLGLGLLAKAIVDSQNKSTADTPTLSA